MIPLESNESLHQLEIQLGDLDENSPCIFFSDAGGAPLT